MFRTGNFGRIGSMDLVSGGASVLTSEPENELKKGFSYKEGFTRLILFIIIESTRLLALNAFYLCDAMNFCDLCYKVKCLCENVNMLMK